MADIRIVICKNQQDANVMFHVLRDDGFNCHPPGPAAHFVFVDATQADPPDPETVFKNHIVLIGTRP
jgi:hypothetical protein